MLDISGREGLYYKIADTPVSWQKEEDLAEPKKPFRFTRPAPFDCFFLRAIPAYVVVMFYKPRAKKNVYYIRVDDFINMVNDADRKSMTEEMAGNYAEHVESYLKG